MIEPAVIAGIFQCIYLLFLSILQILSDQSDKDWFKAEQNGREGVIPKNYVQVKPRG